MLLTKSFTFFPSSLLLLLVVDISSPLLSSSPTSLAEAELRVTFVNYFFHSSFSHLLHIHDLFFATLGFKQHLVFHVE